MHHGEMATTASNGDRSIRPIADIDIAAVAEALSDNSSNQLVVRPHRRPDGAFRPGRVPDR